MNKGLGMISLIVTIALIGILVWVTWYFSGSLNPSQIQSSQQEIQDAKNAANQETQYNQTLQDQVQSIDNGGVNYRAAQQQIK